MASVWDSVIQKTHQLLSEKGVQNIVFDRKDKERDSYAKAKTGHPCSYWTFGRTDDDVWIEFELLPRTRKGQRTPQTEEYQIIAGNRPQIERECEFEITWDEEDRGLSRQDTDRKVYRIKSYIPYSNGYISSRTDELASKMVKFIGAIYEATKKKN